MNSKLVILAIAVAAVGMVAAPSTLALFAGQHNWYDISTLPYNQSAPNIPCQKCHADIYAELYVYGDNATNGASTNWAHQQEGCSGCHVVDAPQMEGLYNGDPRRVGGNDPNATSSNIKFHAATVPACLDCHGNSSDPYGAVGIGDSNIPDASLIVNGPNEAHTFFAAGANQSGLLKDYNAACIGCHTHVAVSINWQHAYLMSFNASVVLNQQGHNWTVNNFTASGTANTTSYGNQAGNNTNAAQYVISSSATGFNASNP